MAAYVLQPLQFSPSPRFAPVDVRTPRALSRQVRIQKEEPPRWADSLPHIRHFAMFLGHRTGVIAKLSKCRDKGCLSGSAYTCNLDQVSLHFAAPIGGQKSSLRQLSYFLN